MQGNASKLEAEMSVYKRGGIYWYQFIVHGRRIRESAKTANRAAALRAEARRRNEIFQNGFSQNSGKDLHFENVFAEFIDWTGSHVKPRTHQRYKVSGKRLGAHFGMTRLQDIGTKSIEDFKTVRSEECSNAGVNRDLACLRTFRNWCSRLGYTIGLFHVRMLPEGPGNMRVVSREEERAYMDHAGPLLRDVATIILETGMRPGEVFQLRSPHVQLHEPKHVYIPSGKTRFARRTIPLTDRACQVLVGRMPVPCRQPVATAGQKVFVLGSWRGDEQPLFPGKAAAQIVMRRHKALVKRLGLDFRLYDFRHTFGTRMAMAGVDLMTLRELMGHSSITITQRYCHPTPEHKREAMEKLADYNEGQVREQSVASAVGLERNRAHRDQPQNQPQSQNPATKENCTEARKSLLAERGGFEPPVEVLAPTTV
jgi:integrase